MDVKEYIENLKQKCGYYMTPDGVKHTVPDRVFENLGYRISCNRYPEDVINQQSLLAIAKWNNKKEIMYSIDESDDEVKDDNTVSDDEFDDDYYNNDYDDDDYLDYTDVTRIYNNSHPQNKITELPEYKVFALDQLIYNKDCFPNEQLFEKACAAVLELPNDKVTVYKHLYENSCFNLNYVPNKIRLIDDFMTDKIDMSFSEKEFFLYNKSIKFDDLIGFADNNKGFSKQNYVRSVNKIVEILDNHDQSQQIFRKMFQYKNVENAVRYYDYGSYNYNEGYYNDTDRTIENVLSDEQYNYMLKNGLSITSEIPAYNLPDDKNSVMDTYDKNQEFVINTAFNLSSIFGSSAGDFMDRYAEVNGGTAPQEYKESEIDKFEDDLEFISKKQLEISKRINQGRLHLYSYTSVSKPLPTPQIHKYSKETQQRMLTLLSILPSGLSVKKCQSLKQFMQNSFSYKDTGGSKRFHSLKELQKIFDIWPKLTEKQEKLTYKQILTLANSKNYNNAQKLDFSNEAQLHGLSPALFDVAQKIYINGSSEPRIIKDNYRIEDNDFVVRLLDVKDPKVMFIGSGFSCQTIDKIGAYPAVSSVKDPFSRAMVVEKKSHSEDKENTPIGLAWLWVGNEAIYDRKYNSMCIDSLEIAEGYYKNMDQIMGLTKRLSIKIADENNMRRVTIGQRSVHYDPERYFDRTEALNLPESYLHQSPIEGLFGKIDYGDSHSQLLVYDNPAADDIKEDDRQYFVVHRNYNTYTDEEYDKCVGVARIAYASSGIDLHEMKQDKTSELMLLKNYQNKIIGYALYSDVERHVYDVAVLGSEKDNRDKTDDDRDKYRKFSKIMLRELLEHMKDVGGEWKAECRHNTSYKLLQYLAHKKVIKLSEGEMGTKLGDEVLHNVSFSFAAEAKEDKQCTNSNTQNAKRNIEISTNEKTI